jgi:tetratricopeptide (TPR) repeat protein
MVVALGQNFSIESARYTARSENVDRHLHSMSKMLTVFLSALQVCGLLVASGAQISKKAPVVDPMASAQQGISLAAKGRCREALPVLRKTSSSLADKQLKYQSTMSIARCAMSLNQMETAVQALLLLNREFPHDPEVLYTTTHFFSELASRASQDLAATSPTSPQAQQLDAEAFESQGNWDKAAAEYKRILEQNPRLPGIHYRLGRIFLAKTPADAEEAKKEFDAELKIDPSNASAEFMLGEMDRQAGQWDQAAAHFLRASKIDEGFAEAYLALGMSLNSAGKFPDAIAPLQTYVKMQPADPAGHYQLGTAYARSGHKQEAEKEMALQREAAAKSPREPAPQQ